MQIIYDPQANAIYIQLNDLKIRGTRTVNDFVNVDVTADGKPVGIELLEVSQFVDDLKTIAEKYDIHKALAAKQEKRG